MNSLTAPNQHRRVIWLLAFVSLIGYALRSNIAIAQEYMAPELGLSMAQMGVISAWGFQLAYAVFQIPGGFLGDRFGARRIMALAVVGWSIASFASGSVAGGAGLAFAALFGTRVLLGISQAATYPVAAIAAAEFVPESQRVGASAIYLAAGSLGAAIAPLLLAPLMVHAGWRAVFTASAIVGLATAALWYLLAPRSARATSTTHPRISVSEQLTNAARVLRNGRLLLLTTSYFLHSAVYFVFVFWFFRYLTESRGFSVLDSGIWGSVPYFMAFAIAPLVGIFADSLARRMPPAIARRRVAMSCLTIAATFVFIGARLPTPGLAIVALGLSVACLVSCEAPYWTSTTAMAGEAAGSAGGALNLMGNLGGVMSIWLVPLMKDAWGWAAMLAFWGGIALVAAALWQVAVRPYAPVIASVSHDVT